MTTPPTPSEVQAAKERLIAYFQSDTSLENDWRLGYFGKIMRSHDSLTARVAELEKVLRDTAILLLPFNDAFSTIQNAMKKEVRE